MEIPRELLKGLAEDSIRRYLNIRLEANTVPVLGELTIREEMVLFEPLLAFTPGLIYEVRLKDELIATTKISPPESGGSARVIAVYPSMDTLPQNLLKLYIEFSKPMQEGYALENIALIRNETDTVPAAFLDLQPELWNKERTIITIWLDPGRIKRDLQPNKRLGAPLESGNHYRLLIRDDWRDATGNKLGSFRFKNFFTGAPDLLSPKPDEWIIQTPRPGTKDPLTVILNEPLDHYLLKNMVWITDNRGKTVNGVIETIDKERRFLFSPSSEWKTGNYILNADSKLEDIAGNNLNRLFDRDLTKKSASEEKQVYQRSFKIE